MLNEITLENYIMKKILSALKGQKTSKKDAEDIIEQYIFKPGINPEIAISIKEDIVRSLLKAHKILK